MKRISGATRVHDGCLSVTYRWPDKTTVSQRKRRPAGKPTTECLWHPTLRCDDHPNREAKAS